MMPSEKFAYRGSLLAFLAVFLVIVAAGFIGERIGRSRGNFDKAEGFIADLHAIATRVPRFLDGFMARQGDLSTAWMDDVGALPAPAAGDGRRPEGRQRPAFAGACPERTVVRRRPHGDQDSLVWTQLSAVPKAVCREFGRAMVKHLDQVAYVSSFGNPAVPPATLDQANLCQTNFNNFAVITLDAPTEVRRLAADIQNAVRAMPANLTEKIRMSGSSAPFQVDKGQNRGPGFIQRDQSGIRVTINNLPLAVCRLALLIGPNAFGMDAFHAPDGKKIAPSPPASSAITMCNDMKGRLIMSRS